MALQFYWSDLDTIWAQNFQIFFVPFLESRMVCLGISNDLSNESQILSHKQNTDVEILCYLNKARVLLMFIYVWYLYEFQTNVAFLLIILFINTFDQFILFGTSYFVKKEIAISVLCIICTQIYHYSFVYMVHVMISNLCISLVTWFYHSNFSQSFKMCK